MTQYEFMCKMRDNGYSCSFVNLPCNYCCSSGCPLIGVECGFLGNKKRKQLVDAWIKQYEDEHMDKLEDLEKAYKELGEKIEAMKKPKIVFDGNKNYGAIRRDLRYILSYDIENQCCRWHSFADCCSGWYSYNDCQKAIDRILLDGFKVIELDSTPEAVANFLIGK